MKTKIAYLLSQVADKSREIHRAWTIPVKEINKIDSFYIFLRGTTSITRSKTLIPLNNS